MSNDDQHFLIIMMWLSMIAAMIEKSNFRYVFFACFFIFSLVAAWGL